MGVSVRFHRGAWWIFVRHAGRRRAKRIGDRETALRVARALREKLARGELALPATTDQQTLKAYAEAWLLTAAKSLKASTLTFYRGHLDQHVFPALGSRPVGSLTRQDCRALVASCRAKDLRVTTVRGIVRALSTILTQAVEDDLLPANPALRLGRYLRPGDEPISEPEPFTREEVGLLLQAAREHFAEWYPWVLCGLRTGMRAGELLGLQWGDVDWHGRYLNVERNIVRGTLTTPKNHQRRRIDMSPQLRAQLRLWRRHQAIVWLKKGEPRPDWIFASSTGTALDESNVRKAFGLILDKAGLHRRGPHQMRHTFGSLLINGGEPVTYVSQQMGHRDSSITLKVYARWLPDVSGRKGVDRLDDVQLLATPAQPDEQIAVGQNAVSPLDVVVSRLGIEPRTRRLRVCCSTN